MPAPKTCMLVPAICEPMQKILYVMSFRVGCVIINGSKLYDLAFPQHGIYRIIKAGPPLYITSAYNVSFLLLVVELIHGVYPIACPRGGGRFSQLG
jgi:hypothetical protein